jgi:serine/threonine-protein kinase RsbW
MVTTVSLRDERTALSDLSERTSRVGVQSVAAARQGETVNAGDLVELNVPADPAYLAVIRTATAGLAARLDLTLDEIEDLRIAVDEACGLLLDRRCHDGKTLRTSFSVGAGVLDVVIAGPADVLPDDSSFAWSVLQALAGDVETGSNGSGSWIRLTHVGGRR